MKLAISATAPNLEAEIDPRFGRAACFIIVDPDTLEFEAVENRQQLDLPQGAGIQAGKTVADRKVEALITGHCGPKAFKVLQAAGIDIFLGAKGSVKAAVEKYKSGNLKASESPDVESHWI